MQATVTKEGKVTIPKAIRDRLGLKPGSRVSFNVSADGGVVLQPVEGDRFDRMVGTLKTDMTTEEIMALLRGDDGV